MALSDSPELPETVLIGLRAAGFVGEQWITRPRDAVAAWLLRTGLQVEDHPIPSRDLFGARIVGQLIDRALAEEFAAAAGSTVAVTTIGGGFDGRWADFEGVAEWSEVEEPEILALKQRLLRGSPFSRRWSRVSVDAERIAAWRVPHRDVDVHLVVLQRLGERLGESKLRALLRRVRAEERAVVFLDLGELPTSSRPRWSNRVLAQQGWRVVVRHEHEPRRRVADQTNEELIGGVGRQHLLRLVPL